MPNQASQYVQSNRALTQMNQAVSQAQQQLQQMTGGQQQSGQQMGKGNNNLAKWDSKTNYNNVNELI